MITIGGASSFSVNDTATAARIARWAAEADPWVHIYGQYDFMDAWHAITVASAAGVTTVNIVNHSIHDGPIGPRPGKTLPDQAKFYGANLLCEL